MVAVLAELVALVADEVALVALLAAAVALAAAAVALVAALVAEPRIESTYVLFVASVPEAGASSPVTLAAVI